MGLPTTKSGVARGQRIFSWTVIAWIARHLVWYKYSRVDGRRHGGIRKIRMGRSQSQQWCSSARRNFYRVSNQLWRVLSAAEYTSANGRLEQPYLDHYVGFSSTHCKTNITKRSKEYGAKIKPENGGCVYWSFKSTTATQISLERGIIGIHPAYKTESTEQKETTASAWLAVGKVSAIYERLGFGWIDEESCERYDKAGKGFV